MASRPPVPVYWVGTSKADLREFPTEVRYAVGHALFEAQTGGKHESAKPLKGFGGAGVLEIVEDYSGDTYRAVYTVRLGNAVYVLHAFQKKSTQGRKTSPTDLKMIHENLKAAQAHAKQGVSR